MIHVFLIYISATQYPGKTNTFSLCPKIKFPFTSLWRYSRANHIYAFPLCQSGPSSLTSQCCEKFPPTQTYLGLLSIVLTIKYSFIKCFATHNHTAMQQLQFQLSAVRLEVHTGSLRNCYNCYCQCHAECCFRHMHRILAH